MTNNMGNDNLAKFLDVGDVILGKDGQVFVTTSDGTDIFLAEVDTFQAQMSINTVTIQPIGQAQQQDVFASYAVTVNLTEIVIRDDVMLDELYADIAKGYIPLFDIQGKLRRRDGQVERQIFKQCIPKGNIDLMNITPGDTIKRQWSFACNQPPVLQDKFTTK